MAISEVKAIRRFRRFRGYDYSRGAALFISIVTNPRRRLFGEIVEAKLQQTPLGLAVSHRLGELNQNLGIRLFNSVVMPDHVHLQLHLRAGLPDPLITLGRAMGRFKSLCAKDFHELTGQSGSLWQAGYHDWLCQSAEMIAAVNRYIDYNPLKYELRYNQPAFLALREPLAAWRLSSDEFWRGIGAVELLDGETPLIALRISRKLSPRQIEDAVAHSAARGRFRVCRRLDQPRREGGARPVAGSTGRQDYPDLAIGDAARLQGRQPLVGGDSRPAGGDYCAWQQ